MRFFTLLYQALQATTAEEKCVLVQDIYTHFHSLKFTNEPILLLEKPTFANFCPILPKHKVPQGKILKTDLNFAHLLHSLAHIEFSAIDLALDCAYRFRNLPLQYYFDWIEVANEEVRHFLALHHLLNLLGYQYGDFGVHTTLFDCMQSCDILIDRIAIIPRGMEAIGLDVNPFLCAKVSASKHTIKEELLEVLNTILKEEISHVSKGDIWFHYCCNLEKIPPKEHSKTYFEILQKHHFSFPKANSLLNTKARLKAGFTQEEIDYLGQNQ
ncbi:MAG: ferritin-like domain-containing protein [Helicobacter sp.]|nr:ferritin-like domain-containing protein [Helicobacter sp.]